MQSTRPGTSQHQNNALFPAIDSGTLNRSVSLLLRKFLTQDDLKAVGLSSSKMNLWSCQPDSHTNLSLSNIQRFLDEWIPFIRNELEFRSFPQSIFCCKNTCTVFAALLGLGLIPQIVLVAGPVQQWKSNALETFTNTTYQGQSCTWNVNFDAGDPCWDWMAAVCYAVCSKYNDVLVLEGGLCWGSLFTGLFFLTSVGCIYFYNKQQKKEYGERESSLPLDELPRKICDVILYLQKLMLMPEYDKKTPLIKVLGYLENLQSRVSRALGYQNREDESKKDIVEVVVKKV